MANQARAEPPTELTEAIERACRAGSRFWLHLGRPRNVKLVQEVEIRIDVPVDIARTVTEIGGWRIAEVRPEVGMLFLRRLQPLTRDAVRTLIVDAITLAYEYGGQFHSWTHERELLNWNEPRA
jgi:hypothetical protein